MHSAVGVDSPELPGALGPVGITGEQHIGIGDGQIVRLIHAWLMGEDTDGFRNGVEAQHIVPGQVGHEQLTLPVKPQAIGHAAGGHIHKGAMGAIRRDPSKGKTALPESEHGEQGHELAARTRTIRQLTVSPWQKGFPLHHRRALRPDL